MAEDEDGCGGAGCGLAVIGFWAVGFTLLKVTGNAALSWWYVIAPVWWPVWVVLKLTMGFIGLVIALVVAILAVMFIWGWMLSRNGTWRPAAAKRPRKDQKAIDVECVEDGDGT